MKTIQGISNKYPEYASLLVSGYVRSLTLNKFITLYRQIDNENLKILRTILGYYIRSFKISFDAASEEHQTKYVVFFISEFVTANSYNKMRLIGSFLNDIYEYLPDNLRENIIVSFLNSEKRTFRKYAYKKKLDKLSPNILHLSLTLALKDRDELNAFLKTVAYQYDDQFIHAYCEQFLQNQDIKPVIIKQLCLRYKNFNLGQVIWLKDNYPETFLYIAAVKGYIIDNTELLSLYEDKLSSYFTEERNQDVILDNKPKLILWSLARMNKFNIIDRIKSDHEYFFN